MDRYSLLHVAFCLLLVPRCLVLAAAIAAPCFAIVIVVTVDIFVRDSSFKIDRQFSLGARYILCLTMNE